MISQYVAPGLRGHRSAHLRDRPTGTLLRRRCRPPAAVFRGPPGVL